MPLRRVLRRIVINSSRVFKGRSVFESGRVFKSSRVLAVAVVAATAVLAGAPGGASAAGGVATREGQTTPPLPLGPAGLTQSQSTEHLAPGVTLATITRGNASPDDYWTVNVGFEATWAQASALAGQLKAQRH